MHFKDRELQAFWISPTKCRMRRIPPPLHKAVFRKLQLMDAAEAAKCLNDLRVPPGNRLEALRGDREGQYSIRVNDQWRICFRWTEFGIVGVELVGYH